jgi:hypothetical protein
MQISNMEELYTKQTLLKRTNNYEGYLMPRGVETRLSEPAGSKFDLLFD